MNKDKRIHPVARYFLNIALAVDQVGNSLWGGDPDETISSRLGKMEKKHGGKIEWRRPIPRLIASALHIVDKGHCKEAIEADEGKNAILDREVL